MESGNKIDWTIYDSFPKFSDVDAACLMVDIEPSREIEEYPPLKVRAMLELLRQWVSDQPWQLFLMGRYWKRIEPSRLSREDLIRFCNEKNIHPPFLFEDARDGDSIHGSERKSYLKVLRWALKYVPNFRLEDNESTAKLMSNTGISKPTALKILNALRKETN